MNVAPSVGRVLHECHTYNIHIMRWCCVFGNYNRRHMLELISRPIDSKWPNKWKIALVYWNVCRAHGMCNRFSCTYWRPNAPAMEGLLLDGALSLASYICCEFPLEMCSFVGYCVPASCAFGAISPKRSRQSCLSMCHFVSVSSVRLCPYATVCSLYTHSEQMPSKFRAVFHGCAAIFDRIALAFLPNCST